MVGSVDGRLITEQSEGANQRADLAAFGERSLTAFLQQVTGREPIGVDLKINYLERPGPGALRAETRLIHRTRRTALVECDVTAGDRAVARVAGNYLVE